MPLPSPASFSDDDASFDPSCITMTPIVLDGREIGRILRGVLTLEECRHFIDFADNVDGGLVDTKESFGNNIKDIRYRHL